MSTDLVGRTVGGKFRLRRVVGVGSSGSVYEADQTSLGRTVAVKVLKPELTANQRVAERFHHEALLASRLNHPNTISIIDYGTTPDGLLFMVMEYLRGQTLTQKLHAGSLDLEQILSYGIQILDGLEEAHESGVVHADLKADNIMVERRRGSEHIKVVDFGIAQLLGTGEIRSEELANEIISGTPEYMAPEIVRGADPGIGSDLYSVGILLYELVCGSTPFAGGPVMDILKRQLKAAPQKLSERVPGVSVTLEEVIEKALSKAPKDRFPSAAEFRAALQSCLPRARQVDRVLCRGCGVQIASSFHFCPECGHANVEPAAGAPDVAPRSIDVPKASPAPLGETSPGRVVRPGAGTQSYRHRAKGDTIAAPTADSKELLDFGDAPSMPELDAPGPAGKGPLLDIDAGTTEPALEALPPDTEVPTRVEVFPLPQVGREAQEQKLFEFLTASCAENLLQVTGRPGAGKARVIVAAAERAAEVGAFVVLAEPDPSGLKTPFYPIRSLLTAILELDEGGSKESLASAIRSRGLNERDLPGLLDLFGYETELSELESPVRRRELLSATIRVLALAASQQQAALIFCDVDRYDRPSQDLLRRLAERADEAKDVRLVVSSSDAYSATWPELTVLVRLGDLDDAAIDALAAHLRACGSTAMPQRDVLIEICHRRFEHIYQLVRFALEGGSVATAPASAVDTIAARIGLLPYEAQLIAQVAAVFGTEIDLRILKVAASEHFDAKGVEGALAVLVARGYVEISSGQVVFHQSLVRDVIYDATPADVRRALHDLAHTVLEAEGMPELIKGHHADLAGQPHIAAALLERAGDSYVHQLDDAGASELFRRALAAAREILMSSPSEAAEAHYVAVSVKLADSLRVMGELSLARGVLAEARRYAQETPALTATIDRAEGSLLALEGWLEPAQECLRRGLSVAIQTGQAQLMTELYLDLASVLVRGGKPDAAMAELREGIDLLTLGEGPSGKRGAANVWMMVFRLAKVVATLGDHREAARLGEAALERAASIPSPVGRARIRGFLAQVYSDLGDTTREGEHRRLAIAELRIIGDRRGTAELLMAAARPTMDLGRSGPELLREARQLASEVEDSVNEPTGTDD